METSIENGIYNEEELIQKHKKERKELQSKIQSLKKSATKGDKKKKKEVQEEIAKLESDLDKKHHNELLSLSAKESVEGEVTNLSDKLQEDLNINTSVPRVTKAQKRRDKKAAEQREREKRIVEQEIENENGQRNVEIQKINEILKKRNLVIHEISADGNCLYNAVDHQLCINSGFRLGTDKLRLQTSEEIKGNKEEYLPFLSNPVTGEFLTESQFSEYCENIANTTNWGGQVEIKALSHVVKHPIEVIQADGPSLIMGEEHGSNNLVLTYHRHMYKLGEHYNSVEPFVETDDFS